MGAQLSSRNTVFVEIDFAGEFVRILKPREAFLLEPEVIRQYPRAEAIKKIRARVFELAKNTCKFCGRRAEPEGPMKGDMHEVIPRGQGGEISITNSVALCRSCHNTQHELRRPRL